MLEAAAAQLEAAKEDLILQDGKIVVRGSAGKSVSYVDAIRFTKANNLLGHGVFVSGSGPDGSPVVMDFETGQGYGSAEWHPAVVVCEVEVDTETGKVKVLRLHAELYAGKVINPLLSELQVQGATTFGLGQVLFEELAVDTNGSITNPNLSDYMIPSFEDVPAQLTVHLLEPHGVTDVHGIGETAIPPARPAIGNAISRAVGTHFLDLPITPEKVLRALEQAKKSLSARVAEKKEINPTTMPNIKFLQPKSLDEAVSLLASEPDETKIISGGTALVIMLRNRLIAPSNLLSLRHLQELRSIRHEPGTGLRIGGLVTIREAEISPLVREKNLTLAQTFGRVGNVRVRNAATVGGNLSEADYASDPPCVLVALRARVKAKSVRGEREIPLAHFFKDFYETTLAPDEILTELIVPDPAPGSRSSYLKYISRSSEDRPCVGMAVVVKNEPDGSCQELRLVAGAVSEIPQEIESAEAMARGKRLTDSLIEEIAGAYAAGIEPLSDLRGSAWYRKQIIRVMARRAIQQAMAGN